MRKNSHTKSPRLISALKKKEFQETMSLLGLEDLMNLSHYVGEFLYWWMGIPSANTLQTLRKKIPLLDQIIDFNIVDKRIQSVDSMKRDIYGVSAKDYFPELYKIRDACISNILQLPNSINKAECWLKPIADSAGANADIEAAIYFRSRGQFDQSYANELKSTWYRYICKDIERGTPFGKIPDSIVQRAKEMTISLAEAAKILEFNESLPPFFSYRDEEEDFINAAMFRAVEWFGITGFDPWLKSSVYNDLSVGPINGIEPARTSWWLFHWCRSDLSLQMAERQGLEAWLWALINGQIERDKPWRVFDPTFRKGGARDYVPIAAIIVFIWHRIKPANIKRDILEKAVAVLLSTQMNCGGWPLHIDDSKPDFIATCAAIHGLVLHKPNNWQQIVQKAADWLLNQQEGLGYWHIGGGPTVMLTVLALDSIELGRGGKNVTFKVDSLNKNNIKSKLPIDNSMDTVYSYTGQLWYDFQLPKLKSVSKEVAKKRCKPQIAFLVATEIELQQVLRLLKPLQRESGIWRITYGQDTFYVGKFGKFQSVIQYSAMGADGVSGSMLSSSSLIQHWDPKVIILLGIAFGVNRKKQLCADVLISDNLILYEMQRVGSKKTIFRNPMPPASPCLVNRFRNAIEWCFLRPDGTKCKIHVGPILTGAKLVDNSKFKESLTNQFPHAIGGEMEGAGLWAVAHREKKEWIIVKGVCDWGDGYKHNDYQIMAAAAAASLCHFVFSNKHALDGI